MQSKNISIAVIKRLPRYYRYLGELLAHDVVRISSKELSEKIIAKKMILDLALVLDAFLVFISNLLLCTKFL